MQADPVHGTWCISRQDVTVRVDVSLLATGVVVGSNGAVAEDATGYDRCVMTSTLTWLSWTRCCKASTLYYNGKQKPFTYRRTLHTCTTGNQTDQSVHQGALRNVDEMSVCHAGRTGHRI